MSENHVHEDVSVQFRQVLDELALQSMADGTLNPEEAAQIHERFEALARLAADSSRPDLAELASKLNADVCHRDAEMLLPCLREATALLQVQLELEPPAAPVKAAAASAASAVKVPAEPVVCAPCAAPVAPEATAAPAVATPAPVAATPAPAPPPSQIIEPIISGDPSLIADFVVEAREHLSAAEEHALALEKEPTDTEAINALFRAIHSIKGLAAFLEFNYVQQFAHETETLLDCARQGEVPITSDLIDLILAAAEFLGKCVDGVEAGRNPSPTPESVAQVEKLREAAAKAVPQTAVRPPAPAAVEAEPFAGEQLPSAAPAAAVEAASAEPVADAPEPGGEDAAALPHEPLKTVPLPTIQKQPTAERFSIRVDASRLDHLMDMVGELVIAESLARTGLAEVAGNNTAVARNIAQMAQITSEVQRTTIRMRMVPIGQLMRRTGKIVRDVSRKCEKRVDVEYEGEETEVDKTIAEELADPLMHIVRNAIDHGIESAEDRAKAGKKPVATIRITASHEGSQIVVTVSDDGRGLDRNRIFKKAVERGLIAANAELTDAAVADLIFSPGFSTAEKITTVSGRGVGMDVVRKHVERLRGRVDVKSVSGGGTTFTIRLPLTRAIIDGLVVRVGESRYIIPMSYVREIFRPTEAAVSTVHGKGELVMLHDRLLPIVHLSRAFGLSTETVHPWEAVLIVAESNGRQICLMAEEMVGKQEVVVKSLGKYLAQTPGVCGGTILGDGRVGLILDMQNFEVHA